MHQFEMEKKIARALRNGETVNITPSREPVSPTDPKARQGTTLVAPEGKLASDDAAAEKRKEIARALRNGETVNITPSGEPVSPTDPKARQGTTLVAPEGKLATGFYWYEKNPELLKGEKDAMKIYFPHFKLGKLDDDRLYWVGTLKPRGKEGIEWTLQVVYANNHPQNTTYGGSIRVYSIKPDLNELNESLGGIPHLLKDENDYFYMCSKRPTDLDNGVTEISSATKSLGWASRWIWVIEGWMNGELSDDDVRGHKY